MPQRHDQSLRNRSLNQSLIRSARRRTLWVLLLVPASGCTTGSLTQVLPWLNSDPAISTSDEKDKAAPETETYVAKKKSIFQLAAFRPQEPDDMELEDLPAPQSVTESAGQTIPAPVPNDAPVPLTSDPSVASSSPQVIDLASALGLAGGNAWTIQLARQRTVEAHADWKQAKAMWLPSLQLGVGWNNHAGRIQATDGEVIEASRGSLFLGGGAKLGQSPIAGGSGGPLRLSADLALADAYFAPKVAARQFHARKAGVSVAQNKALMDAALAYVDLVEATGQVADAQSAIVAASELLTLTRKFADAGAGAQADVDRAATEQARLNQLLLDANRQHRTSSAQLARRLRLDPRFELQPADQFLMPLELNSTATERESLIASAHSSRPELSELAHQIAGLCLSVRQAEIEPWIPKVAMTSSAGNFGGGNGSDLDNRAGRSDVDLQAVWEIENLGLGNAARRSRAGSQLAQQRTILEDIRDQITTQVVTAYEDVINYRSQIDSANAALGLAQQSYERNLQRVRADEGLPIELLQAISARANGLRDRTDAVANYNRAQVQLLYASGKLQ